MEDFDTARELNRETPDEARRTALAAEIEQRVKKLGPRIPRLRVIVENPVAEMVVRCDGERLDADEIGVPVLLDPGVHVLTAEAAGFDAEPQRVTLKEEEQARVTLRFTPRSFASQHKLSLGLALGGVALAGAGAGLAAWTASSHAELSEICRTMGAAACRSTMADLDTKAILTNVAFAAAGVAAASAVVVFAVAERPQGPKVQASIRGTFATVGVAW
jgi:hypothetical protein